MIQKILVLGFSLWLIGMAHGLALAMPYYANDFTLAVGSEWTTTGALPPGINTTPSGRNFLGERGGQYGLSNETVTLTLTDLPSHHNVYLSFSLFIIQSWDGNGESDYEIGHYGIDIFDLKADGVGTLLHTTFRNVPYPSQSFPDMYSDTLHASSNPSRTGAAESDTLGYPFWGDTVYNLEYTFPHSSSILAVRFTGAGLQHIEDESWGLANVRVDLAMPEPSTWLLLSTGLVLLVLLRRHNGIRRNG